MIIKIDTRETDLLKACQTIVQSIPKYNTIQICSQPLPLGDIIINDGTNDCIIIERKTINDLSASIKDGRYEEQSYRLNGIEHHNHNIIYLIEGDLYRYNSFKDRVDKQTIYSAMFSINYFKGFSVMRTSNIDETATVLCNMVYKLVCDLKKGKKAYYSLNKTTTNSEKQESIDESTNESTNESPNELQDDAKVNQEKAYCSVVKKVKKDNVTSENIGEIMLCQIPGISSTTAIAILQQFHTLPNLIKSIQQDESCLNNVCTTDSNGKSRKISKSNTIKNP